jgi:hypothetical protein
MQFFKARADFKQHETQFNMLSGFLGGAIGSAITNAFDVITINKQTQPELKIGDMIRQERWNLMTKGLLARVYYNSMQSIVFFHLVLHIGRMYDVELSDD